MEKQNNDRSRDVLSPVADEAVAPVHQHRRTCRKLNWSSISPSSRPQPSHSSSLSSSSSSHIISYHSTQPIELPLRPEKAHLSPDRTPTSLESPASASSVSFNECCAPQIPHSPRNQTIMGLSKTQRISVLLAIDSVFFLIEIVIGMPESTSAPLRFFVR